MRFLYSLLLALVSPLFLFNLYKKKAGKPHIGIRWKEHFGFTPELNLPAPSSAPIWIHTVSVGEVLASKPIILTLKKNYPHIPIIITTTTTTGAAQATKIKGVTHRYMPIDFAWCIKGFLRQIKPQILLIMETELWPNTLYQVHKKQIPIIVMNARLSKKSQQNYQRIKPIFNLAAPYIRHIICQFKADQDRFLALGIPREKLDVGGSVKFDLSIPPHIIPQGKQLAQEWHNRPTWIAASTHKGENKLILQAHKKILASQPDALLLLVPRHPEDCAPVYTLIQDLDLTCTKRSTQNKIEDNIQVYLGDTMGEMLLMFAATDISFMAGSLLGGKVGGHNVLEPAALSKPILTGPSYFNFQIITEQLINKKACIICASPEQIAHHVLWLMQHPTQQKNMGEQALKVVKENQGAVNHTLHIIAPYLSSSK